MVPTRVSEPPGSHMLTRWQQHTALLTLAACGVYAAIYILWLLFPWGNPDYRTFITNLACLPLTFCAAVFAAVTGRRHSLDPAARRGWYFLAAAYLSLFGGDALWFYYESILELPFFPSAADIGYLSFYPLVLGGTLSFRAIQIDRSERVKFWLDTLIVTLGGGMVLWYFILYPIVVAENTSWIDTTLSLAYPVGDLVLLFSITVFLLRTATAKYNLALQFLVAGMLVFFCGDLGYVYLNLQEVYESGDWPDAAWNAAYFLWIVSGFCQYRQVGSSFTALPHFMAEQRALNPLPYGGVAIGYGMLVFVAGEHWGESLGGLILGLLPSLRLSWPAKL